MRSRGTAALLVASACMAAVVLATPRNASGATVVQPATPVVAVSVTGGAYTSAVTVVATGFAPGALVYVEQCDGTSPSTPSWSPTAHCDLGSAPSPAIADRTGRAAFPSSDANHAFTPFVGESPQSMFNCEPVGHAGPHNQLPTSTSCTMRVSTNNAAVTVDQVFAPLAFRPGSAAPPPTLARPASSALSGTAAPTTAKKGAPVTRVRGSAAPTTAQPSCAPACSPGVEALPERTTSGLLTLSDGRVLAGYLLVIGGGILAAASVVRRRRSPDARVTAALPAGE